MEILVCTVPESEGNHFKKSLAAFFFTVKHLKLQLPNKNKDIQQ